jgi:hypothetical protein
MRDHSTITMTPEQLLAAHDKFMSGSPLSDEEKRAADQISIAACFGVSAALTAPFDDAAPGAMLRAFLLALINPFHEDLDYLRADPASGAVERAKREEANG